MYHKIQHQLPCAYNFANYRWPAYAHLYQFFFWYSDSEVEMTKTAGDHGA